jgi:hypothetical protein
VSKVTIELTGDEALVLFEWITRFTERDDEKFEVQAEQKVIWRIEDVLEKALVEPFRPDYDHLMTVARAGVWDESG